MSDVLDNLTHEASSQEIADCHNRYVDVFIKVSFIHKSSGIKAAKY